MHRPGDPAARRPPSPGPALRLRGPCGSRTPASASCPGAPSAGRRAHPPGPGSEALGGAAGILRGLPLRRWRGAVMSAGGGAGHLLLRDARWPVLPPLRWDPLPGRRGGDSVFPFTIDCETTADLQSAWPRVSGKQWAGPSVSTGRDGYPHLVRGSLPQDARPVAHMTLGADSKGGSSSRPRPQAQSL